MSCAVTIFWWIWGILMVAAVIAFVVLDNRWLEDSRRNQSISGNPAGIKTKENTK